MAIQTVKAVINGQSYDLVYNSGNGKWEASITAPGQTSFNQPGGFYNVQITALNDAGTSGSADGGTVEGLRLVVKERVKPVITISSPSSGAFITNDKQPIVGTVTDEVNGSGVKQTTIVVKLDGVPISNVQFSPIANGVQFTATPSTPYGQGQHTVIVDAEDNDGNAAEQKSVTFTVDTVPPTLDVTSPAEGLITNSSTISVIGVTNDATSSPVTVKISLNGEDQGAVSVGGDGGFTKSVTLKEGSNQIVVTATDSAGKSSSVTRNVTLDTSVPQITSATITPNPADAGATVIVSVTIV